MLNQSLKAILFLLISLVWHFNASAQTPREGLSYEEKAKVISLAKSGDAEAFYKLGLAHLSGNGADQNDAIAQRFFFYASEKGHVEANKYLIRITETVEAPTLTKRSTPLKIKENKQKNIAEQKRKRALRRAEAEAKRKKEQSEKEQKKIVAKTVQVSKKAAEPSKAIIKEARLDIIDAPEKIKVAVTTINELPVASAVRSQTILSPNIPLTATKKQSTLSKYFLLTIGLLLLLAFAFFKYLRFVDMRNALPVGFDKKAYLHFNPDVSEAGVDPVHHFLYHGQSERRRFRY